ncbi:hypothetical protein GH733_016900, partial [Mirounga leonina]
MLNVGGSSNVGTDQNAEPRNPAGTEKEEQAAAEKAVTQEEFRGERTAPAPEFTATQPEVAAGSEGVQVAWVPGHSAATKRCSCGSHGSGHRMVFTLEIQETILMRRVVYQGAGNDFVKTSVRM